MVGLALMNVLKEAAALMIFVRQNFMKILIIVQKIALAGMEYAMDMKTAKEAVYKTVLESA